MAPSFLGALAVALFSWGGLAFWREPAVTQPIEYPHKTHLELGLRCTSCHDRAEKDAVAGRPPTALCLSCHAGSDGQGEIKKLQMFTSGGEIPWRRVWRLPRHVLFSHRRHVVGAALKCQTCHGPMETLAKPPPRALRTLTMSDCIGCHEEWPARFGTAAAPAAAPPVQRVSTDCTSCHR